MKLQTRILIGLVAGLTAGFLARLPQLGPLRTIIEWAEPVGTIFIRLITMIVIPLVAGSLFTSVASLGSMRRLGTIGWALRERLDKGSRDERLLNLLAIGAAQILFLDVPDHAGVPGDASGRQRRHGRKPAACAAAAVG